MKIENAVNKALSLGLEIETQNATNGGKILFVKIAGNRPAWVAFTKYLNRCKVVFDYRANYEWIAIQYEK